MKNSDPEEQDNIIRGYLQGEAREFYRITNWIEQVVNHYSWGLNYYSEDIIQEVRLKVFVSLKDDKFRKSSQLKTYVYRIAKYTCIDFLRKSKTNTTENIDSLEITEKNDALGDLISKEKASILLTILKEIAEPCREILRLVFGERLSYKMIGTLLNIAEGTVKSRVSRCVSKATEIKEKYWNDSKTSSTVK